MRLIVLASPESQQINIAGEDSTHDAVVQNTFSINMEIPANSKIALKSITCEFGLEEGFVNIGDFNDFILELQTLELNTFNGYIDDVSTAKRGATDGSRVFKGKLNGMRESILDVIPASQLTQFTVPESEPETYEYPLRWTPAYPTFLDLANKQPFSLNQMSVRLTKYNGESIQIRGGMFVSILIKGPDE